MPVYEYGCAAGHRFEVKQKFSDAPITICQFCRLPVIKLISPSGISFKGSGWYVTDYSDKLKQPTSQEKSGSPTEAKKEKPAAEAKSPSSSESASTSSSSSGSTGSSSSSSTPPAP